MKKQKSKKLTLGKIRIAKLNVATVNDIKWSPTTTVLTIVGLC